MYTVGFSRFGPPHVLETIEVPRPQVSAHTVLMRVAAAGVNPADSYVRSGQFRLFTRLPYVPGIEVVGVVEAGRCAR